MEPSQNQDLYKKFGKETDVGKMLYSLYSAHSKPQVYYPPVKTKARVEAPKEEKKCPQKTVIDYPEAEPKYRGPTYHPVDFIPRRKNKDEIEGEMEVEKNRKLVPPVKAGVNRKAVIEDAQEKFQYKNAEEYLDAKRKAAEARAMKMMP